MDRPRVNALKRHFTIIYCLLMIVIHVECQENLYNNEKYNRHHMPSDGNQRYPPYSYNNNNNGYGDQYRSYLDPINRDLTGILSNPNLRKEDLPKYLRGILAGWREDLQGKSRPNSENLKNDRDVYVNTNYGPVQGFKVYLYDHPEARHRPWSSPVERITGHVHVFLGIPYAMPPTGDGRFKPPRPHRGWKALQAVDWGPACPQPSNYTGATKNIREVNEDCLYLNIFTPPTDLGVGRSYPVMFYIHGGEFIHGASNLFPGHIMAAFYNVIVVTINYRLGALGFLSTGDENSPGNYGILDQAMALKWVYDNIQSFNGDREAITAFGPGAGAASAGLLMVAPRTRHMVSKVIAQSGSPLADWALIIDKYRVQNTSRVYAQSLGCGIESSWKLVECLKSGRTPFDLGNSELKPDVGMFPWAPVLDENFTVPHDNWYEDWRASDWHFFTETPETSIKAGKYHEKIAYMAGVTTQEAAFIIFNNETLRNHQYRIDADTFNQTIWDMVLKYNYTLNPRGVYEAIKYMYTYWPDPKNTTLIRDQYINLLTDFNYVAPFDKTAKLLVDKGVPVYLYVLNTSIEALQLPHWRRVPHDIEYLWLTGAPFMDTEFFPEKWRIDREMWTDNDRNMSHFFMKAYTNFAKYGDPTPSQILGLHFEKAKLGYLKYLNINTTFNSSVLFNYRQTESAFWHEYLPTVIGRIIPIYPPLTEYWWEPKQPLQIAFWSMTTLCLLLIVLSVVCCMLWRTAQRQSDIYYNGDLLMVRDDEHSEGIENITRVSKDNIYEYRDTPAMLKTKIPRQNETKLQERLAQNRKFSSTPSLRTNSNISLKDIRGEGFVTSSPNGQPKLSKTTSQSAITPKPRSKTHVIEGVPQTAV